jgi:NAD-dependent dihydropyrimidine dehydrogenase PreA subunit
MSDVVAIVARPEACDYAGLCETICPMKAIQRPFEILT